MQSVHPEIARSDRTGRRPTPECTPSAPIRVPASSPDVRLLAALMLLAIAVAFVVRSGRDRAAAPDPSADAIVHEGRIEDVAVSPDGRYYASASREGTAKVWDAATRRPVGRSARGPSGFAGVAFAPDGGTLACIGFEGEVVLLDPRTGRESARFAANSPAPLRAGAFSPNGRLFATVGDDRIVRVRDIPSGIVRWTLPGHEDRVRDLAFANDGRSLLSADRAGRVLSWNLASGSVEGAFDAGIGPVWSMSLSPDGGSLALGGREGIALRDLATGRIRATRCGRWPVTNVCFLRSGKVLATADEAGRLAFWDVAGSELRLRREIVIEGDRVNSLAASPNGSTLLTGSPQSNLRTWDLGWLESGRSAAAGDGLASAPNPTAASRDLVGLIPIGSR